MRLIHISWFVILLTVFARIAWATPLLENFEGTFPPAGWLLYETGDGNANWTRTSNAESTWGYSAATLRDTTMGGGVSREWLITPRIGPEASQTTLHFYLRTASASIVPGDSLFVLASTGRPVPSTFTQILATIVPGQDFGSSFAPFSLNLQSFVGATVYIAFLHTAPMSNTNIVMLDSVSAPSLVVPPTSPTNPIPANSAAGVSVTAPLAWTNGSDVRTVDVYLSLSFAEVSGLVPAARELTGVYASNYQPASHFLSNHTYYWRVVSRNPWYQTAGPVWSFTAGTGPLGGSYRVGGANSEFTNIADAVSAAMFTGVSAPTQFSVAAGVYSGPLIFPAIPGASDSNTVTFAKSPGGPVTIQYGSTTDTAVVTFAGADYITLSGLDITAVSGTVRHCIMMGAGSAHNVIRNAVLNGLGSGVAGGDAVMIRGSQCDFNRFESVTARNAVRGFYLDGVSNPSSVGNAIVGCVVDSVRCGVLVRRQAGCVIDSNDVAVNGGAPDEVDGIYVGTTLPGDTVSITRNRIHDLTTSGVYAVGMRVKPDSAMAVVRAFNNFVYGFQNTGGSQVRAVFVTSGQLELAANSILVNDVAATGATYSVFVGTTASGGHVTLLNNILSNREAAAPSYNLFLMLNTALLTTDYNVFHGTGTAYQLGHLGVDLPTLALWSAATGQDVHALAGDPGFASETNLHISSGDGLPSRNGCVISYLTEDIDGDPRHIPPDRGADEYFFTAQPVDVAVTGMPGLAQTYVEETTVSVYVVVQNRSAAGQSAVPVRLFYDDVLENESAVDLPPLALDTLLLEWATPAAPSSGRLRAQCFLAGDTNPGNDSASVTVEIVHAPLRGNYTIGDTGSDYASFLTAVNDLQARGVDGSVTFSVQPGVYPELVTINPYPGQGSDNPVAFRSAVNAHDVHLSSNVGTATVVLNGVRHLTFDGIDIEAQSPNLVGFQILQDADSNTLSHSILTGPSVLATTACGVRISGGGNDGNIFSSLEVSGFYYGIRFEGAEHASDHANRVDSCTVSSSRIAIRTDFQDSTMLRANVVHTGYPGAGAMCYGAYLGSQESGLRVIVQGNTFGGHEGSSGGCAVYCAADAGTADIRNNMITNWNLTGSQPAYGVLAGSGHSEIRFNSIWMTNNPGTGDVIALADTGASTAVIAQNNVIQMSERSGNAWCISHSNGPFSCDYNAFSNRTGGNIHFRVGRFGSADYSTLTTWQAASGMDTHSLVGDPGFVDSLNLHILPNYGLLDDRGVAIPEVTTDFDGQTREHPPAIGADEYTYSIPTNDFSVAWLQTPADRYNAAQTYDLEVRVTNNGSQSHNSVPIRLYFGDSLMYGTLVNLNAGVSDTVTLHWLTPAIGLETDTLKARSFLAGDVVPENDSASAVVTVAGAPLSGSYTIGGVHPDFGTFTEAATHLTVRGVSAAVTVTVRPGEYSESVRFATIPGADSLNRVAFTSANPLAPSTITSPSGDAVIQLVGADYLNFEALNIVAAATCTTAVELMGGSSHNIFRNCLLRGEDSLNGVTVAALVRADSNSDNLFDSVKVGGAFTGIDFEGDASYAQCHDNRITASIIRNARYGVYVGRQIACVIHGNEILPGSPSPIAAACYGVYVSSLGSGGSVEISANRIHGFADGSASSSNRAVGIYAAAANGGDVNAYNNFVYDFSSVGHLKINGFYLSSGNNMILHNSVSIGNVPATGEIAAVYISTGSSQVIKNNILISAEGDVPSYGILLSGGSNPLCDGNDIYGASPLFAIGKLGTTTYGTFAAWRMAGFDSNGISAAPGFVGPGDLHIADTVTVVDGHGVPTGMVTTDIDGDLRGNPPDIGADEYSVRPASVTGFVVYAGGDSVRLIWHHAARATSYRIYASSSANVQPTPVFLLAATMDTSLVDPVMSSQPARRFYLVTAETASAPFSTASRENSSPILGVSASERDKH